MSTYATYNGLDFIIGRKDGVASFVPARAGPCQVCVPSSFHPPLLTVPCVGSIGGRVRVKSAGRFQSDEIFDQSGPKET